MIMRFICSIFMLFSVVLSCDVLAQQTPSGGEQTGILYGENHAFSLTAPRGWVLDNVSGVSAGLDAVFYPAGGSWAKSSAVMYGNGATKDTITHETIEHFMSHDSLAFRENNPDITISDQPSIRTQQGKMARVRRFSYSQEELIAYIDERRIVATIVLTASNKAGFDSARDPFEELVGSYMYISDNHLKKVTEYSVASKAADDNLTSVAGKNYDEAVANEAGNWISQTFSKCTLSLNDSVFAPFSIAIRVGEVGRAEEVLLSSRTDLAVCVENAFKAGVYLKPPGRSWWVRMDFHFDK